MMMLDAMPSTPPPPRPDQHHGAACWVTRWYGDPDPVTGRRPHYTKRFYVASYGEALAAYGAWIGQWQADPAIQDPRRLADVATVTDLCTTYLRHAEQTYTKRGRYTTHVWNVARAMQVLADMFGDLGANDLAPPHLARLRDEMAPGRNRGTINKWLAIIRQAWRWGAERGDVKPEVAQALELVRNVRKGSPGAREPAPVRPIARATLDETLPHCPEPVRALLELIWHTGCRPDEACLLRGCDLERGEHVWLYRPDPAELKLAHLEDQQDEHERIIHLGPQAQAVIEPWLTTDLSAYLFRPVDVERARRSKSDRYTSATLRRAVHRACDATWPPPGALARRRVEAKGRKRWRLETIKERDQRLTDEQREQLQAWRDQHRWSPNQLRHAKATEVRKRYGAEAARVVLGHSHLKTTEIYAERDMRLAAQVARETG